ncbi:MAG: hypothetical protein LBR65_02070 [Culturomica sp.]|jgi:hypothetical protein|nr:hypothetical protein [Culturomica sp.]
MKRIVLILLAITTVWACEDVFEKDISDDRLVIVAPTADAETTEKEQLFLWEELEGADSYLLRIVTPSFETAARCLVDTVVQVNRFEYSLPAGVYEWSLQGCNSAWRTATQKQKLTIIEEEKEQEEGKDESE